MSSDPATPSPEAATEDRPPDRRKQILRAAVEVFAERGFHRTRVSDIAKRAGVAYGLIYHYFESKDDVLNSVFEDNWAVFLKVLREIEASDRSSGEKLSAIADLLVDALRIAPALIQVIIQEVSRSDRFAQANKVGAFHEAFAVVGAIISGGQARGEIRPGLDPQVGAILYFGALETVCTAFMLRSIPCTTDEEAARVKRTITETILHGMLVPPSTREVT